MKLIDKAAVVAEIENIKSIEFNERDSSDAYACMALDMVKDSIDTLEVKEVGFEKERLTWEDIETIGELRLNVALELRRKELESPIKNPLNFTEEDICQEVLKRFKAQKGEGV